MLSAPTPEPDPPDLKYLRTVLAYDLSAKLEYLPRLLGTTDEVDTRAIIQQGEEYILKHYVEREVAKARAAWAEKERRRQSSLGLWVFRGKFVKVEGWSLATREEIVTRVTHKILSEEKAFLKLQKEVELFLKLEHESASSREPIPEDVRVFVWRRDQGRCVRCGSQERIEFDHIIPVKNGGSNTERNIQILCERCNRAKGTSV